MERGRKLLGLLQARTVIKPESGNKTSTRCEKNLLGSTLPLEEAQGGKHMLLNKQSQTFILLEATLARSDLAVHAVNRLQVATRLGRINHDREHVLWMSSSYSHMPNTFHVYLE